jgi:hypothetical protein
MKKLFTFLIIVAIICVGWFVYDQQRNTDSGDTNTTSQSKQSFDKKQYSLTDPGSIWVIANKHNPLQPKTYAPDDLVTPDVPLRLTNGDAEMDLRKVAADALKEMLPKPSRMTLIYRFPARTVHIITRLIYTTTT